MRANHVTLSTTTRFLSQLNNHVLPFLQEYTKPPFFPVSSATAALLVAARFHESGTLYAPTIALQAINFWHKRLMYPVLTAAPLREFLSSARRMLGKRVEHTVLPNKEWIKTLLDHCFRLSATPAERRLGVICAIMLGACARKADVLKLTPTCFEDHPTYIKIYFWDSKTDKNYRLGHCKYISKLHDEWQIVPKIIAYFTLLGMWKIDHTNPLATAHCFLPSHYYNNTGVFKTKPAPFAPAITAAAVDASFRKARTSLHLPVYFTIHGIRVYVATTALQDDIPIEQIKRAGNWVSSAIEMYMEPSTKQLLAASEAVSHAFSEEPTMATRDSVVEPPEWWPTSGQTGPTGWEYSDATRQIHLI